MKKIISYIIPLLLLISPAVLTAQENELKYTDEYLDSVKINKKVKVNNYSLIGVQYGVSLNRMNFSPRMEQSSFFIPEYYGFTYTKYGRMFGMYPYFALQAGLFYGHEGYKFKADEETGYIQNIEGAEQAIYDIVEIPMLAQFHADMAHFKLMANIGLYGGYRLRIERIGPYVSEDMVHKFLDTDRRLDYGLQGGAGFALVFSPVEIHFNAMLRYSWGTIYDPDYHSEYYYRFGYPFDLMFTAGVYFQLGRRYGKTNKMLKDEARKVVYGEN